MTKKPSLPRDVNQRAKAIVELATMDEEELKRFRKEREKGSSQKKSQDKGN